MGQKRDAIFVVDPGTRCIARCNKAVEHVFGYTEREALGRNTEFLHKDHQSYLRFGEKLFPALDAKGVFRSDFETRQKQAVEAKLRQSQKMEAIGTLAGGIAHDFNNILAMIIGYAELAMADTKPETNQHEYLREVYTASLRARDLVKQILSFSRQTEGDRKPVEPGRIVKEAMKPLTHDDLLRTVRRVLDEGRH